MDKRHEIDGLRAIAVLVVILYHAGIPGFAGGYVGVDVFFVISGFLITSLLLNELDRGKISISGFYERRARRILPALSVVTLACLPFAWFWLIPPEYKSFSESLVGLSVFASNFSFWMGESYFAQAAEEMPLLHTWSLAVEEQFYLFFPLLLAFLSRFGRRVAWLSIGGLTLASLAFCEWGARNATEMNFFLLPGRSWELMAGSLAAFVWPQLKGRDPGVLGQVLSILGLTMIAASVALLDADSRFPSVLAIPSVLGASLLLLLARPGTAVGWILSTRAMVGIGLISYSAYLWHQPLFAFARIRWITPLTHIEMLGLSALAVLLAWPTWWLVEQPFRRIGAAPLRSRRAVFMAAAMTSIAMLGVGTYGTLSEGRNANEALRFPDMGYGGGCYFNGYPSKARWKACLENLGDAQRIVMIGDSHSRALAASLNTALRKRNIGLITLSRLGCFPVPGTIRVTAGQVNAKCQDFVDRIYDLAATAQPVAYVIAARWSYYQTGQRFVSPNGFVEAGDSLEIRDAATGGALASPLERAETHIADLAGKAPVLVVGAVPEVGAPVPRLALFAPGLASYPYSAYALRNGDEIPWLVRLGQLPGVRTVDPSLDLCPETGAGRICRQIGPEGPYYFDDDHLSPAGAAMVMPRIVETLLDLLEAR